MKTAEGGISGAEKTRYYIRDDAYNAGWRANYLTDKGDTCIKLYPYFVNGQPQPQISNGDEQTPIDELIGDFVAEYQCVINAGSKKISSVVETKDKLEGVAGVYDQFYTHLLAYSKRNPLELTSDLEKQAWSILHDMVQGSRPALARSVPQLFIKGAVFQRDGQPVLDEVSKQPTYNYKTVLHLSATAAASLKKGLTTSADQAQPLTPENCLLGNILEPDQGSSVRFFCRNEYIERNKINQNVYYAEKGVPCPIPQEHIFGAVLSNGLFNEWDNLIWKPTIIELIGMLAETFTPYLVWIALAETAYRQYVPQFIQDAAMVSQPQALGHPATGAAPAAAPVAPTTPQVTQPAVPATPPAPSDAPPAPVNVPPTTPPVQEVPTLFPPPPPAAAPAPVQDAMNNAQVDYQVKSSSSAMVAPPPPVAAVAPPAMAAGITPPPVTVPAAPPAAGAPPAAPLTAPQGVDMAELQTKLDEAQRRAAQMGGDS